MIWRANAAQCRTFTTILQYDTIYHTPGDKASAIIRFAGNIFDYSIRGKHFLHFLQKMQRMCYSRREICRQNRRRQHADSDCGG